MCREFYRACSNIAKGTCINPNLKPVDILGNGQERLMIPDYTKECHFKDSEGHTNSTQGTTTATLWPESKPNCDSCTAQEEIESLMDQHAASRLKAIWKQKQEEQAEPALATYPAFRPATSRLGSMGHPSTSNATLGGSSTPYAIGGAAFGDASSSPSTGDGRPKIKLNARNKNTNNHAGKSIVASANGGTIGVESLSLGESGSRRRGPTIMIKGGVVSPGPITGKRSRPANGNDSDGNSTANSRTTSQSIDHLAPTGRASTKATESKVKGPGKKDSDVPAPKKKGSAAPSPKKRKKQQSS